MTRPRRRVRKRERKDTHTLKQLAPAQHSTVANVDAMKDRGSGSFKKRAAWIGFFVVCFTSLAVASNQPTPDSDSLSEFSTKVCRSPLAPLHSFDSSCYQVASDAQDAQGQVQVDAPVTKGVADDGESTHHPTEVFLMRPHNLSIQTSSTCPGWSDCPFASKHSRYFRSSIPSLAQQPLSNPARAYCQHNPHCTQVTASELDPSILEGKKGPLER